MKAKKKVTEEESGPISLRHLLRPYQLPVYDFIKHADNDEVVVASHRGSGKSFTGGDLAVEAALSTPNLGVRIFCSTAKMAKSIFFPIITQICASLPEALRPRFVAADNAFYFHNGATIELKGADLKQEDNARGVAYKFTIIDEAGFMKAAEYLYESIILPRMIFEKGKLIWLSTPPVSPAHFYARKMLSAKEDGSLFTYKITDNNHFSAQDIRRYAKKLGGENTTAFRREMMCEILTEEKYALLPEVARGKNLSVESVPLEKDHEFFTALSITANADSVAVLCRSTETRGLVFDRFIVSGQTDPKTFMRAVVAAEVALYGRTSGVRPSNLKQREVNTFVGLTGEPLLSFESTYGDATPGPLRSLVCSDRVVLCPEASDLAEELRNAVFDENLKELQSIRPGYAFLGAQAAMLAATHHSLHSPIEASFGRAADYNPYEELTLGYY